MKPEIPSGLLVIDKAPDMTSHDVVAIARGALKIKKIGHCGTLDPMATGVLMLLINKATKLQDMLMVENKVYEGSLKLGIITDSQDADGEPVEEKEVPDFSEDDIKKAFDKYRGNFEQMPPMVSAIKKDGVRLYKLARQGKVVERDPRPVKVSDYQIHNVNLPDVDFTVHCSKGFYVRTYAHDIGADLGCGAHLSALRRTMSGKFDLTNSIPAMDLKTIGREAILEKLITLEEIAEILK
ncbi:MAG: tRNA pseudouridine55 synthase [Cryomorphaceae bacterium]|jgi:tRNA pseudouridine55 synthase